MELQHRFTVPASVDETWALFNDLEVVAPCFPGAALTSTEGDEFAGTVKIKLGPVSLQYSGTGTFVERDEATHTARIEAKGKDKRGNGTAAAKVKTVLLAEGTGTAVEVSTDLSVTGKPAQFGRGLMQDVSDKLLGRFVVCLTDKLTNEPEAAVSGADTEAAAPAAASAPTVGATGANTQEQGGSDGAGSPDGSSPAGTPASATTEPAGGTAPTASESSSEAPASPTRPRAVPPPRAEQEPVALDLGATVLPVLAKRYGPAALGLVVVLLVLRRFLRR